MLIFILFFVWHFLNFLHRTLRNTRNSIAIKWKGERGEKRRRAREERKLPWKNIKLKINEKKMRCSKNAREIKERKLGKKI